ncbi:hypothetical protein BLOT_002369 [Blomia tropicalis]|nr:hypothetical protein BLOT_002369 [Blomia tropicalis]
MINDQKEENGTKVEGAKWHTTVEHKNFISILYFGLLLPNFNPIQFLVLACFFRILKSSLSMTNGVVMCMYDMVD